MVTGQLTWSSVVAHLDAMIILRESEWQQGRQPYLAFVHGVMHRGNLARRADSKDPEWDLVKELATLGKGRRHCKSMFALSASGGWVEGKSGGAYLLPQLHLRHQQLQIPQQYQALGEAEQIQKG